MKRINLILITLAIFCAGNFSLTAQNEKDKKNDKLTPSDRKYTGPITKKDLSTEYTKSWFNSGMEKYDIPDEMKEKFEATNYKNYTIKAFMGTWCPDSKREIPRLYKLLDEIDFDLDNLTVYTMDYGKNTDDNYEKGLNIHHVPTIIVYDKNGKEIDRFVEKSRQSFLKDMLKIFQKKDYKDSYEK